MTPARHPRDPDDVRMLIVDPKNERLWDARPADLRALLKPDDVLVVNDAATLPASLRGTTSNGDSIEVRLVEGDDAIWKVVLFGEGNWRQRTEDRSPPPLLSVQDALEFDAGLRATITHVSSSSPRLIELRFDRRGDEFFRALYAAGRPIQYAYLDAEIELWSVQTVFAARPWSVEMPSAGRPLTWSTLSAIESAGVTIASLTHAAGLSSTGDEVLDALLPFPERFEIPERTAQLVRDPARRVIAVGTTVVRALEGSAMNNQGTVVAGPGRTDLRIHANYEPRVVDAVLTGIHVPTESHFDLIHAFADRSLLDRALAHASQGGYLSHEFGDLMFVGPSGSTGKLVCDSH